MENQNNRAQELKRLIAEEKEKYKRHLQDQIKEEKIKFETHTEPLTEKLKHWGANTARAGFKGIYGMADLPFLAAEGLKHATQHEIHSMAPKHFPEPEQFGSSKWLPHMADRSEQAMAELTKGYSTPRTEGERLYGDIAQTVLPLGPLGKAGQVLNMVGKAPRVAKALTAVGKPTATNLGATSGSAFLSNRYREGNKNPDPLVDMGLSLAGGIGGGFGAPGVARAIKNPVAFSEGLKDAFAGAVGRRSGFSPKLWQTEQGLGLRSTLGSASKDENMRKKEMYLRQNPVTSKIFNEIDEHNQKGMAKNVGRQASKEEGLGIHEPHEDYDLKAREPEKELVKEGASSLYKKKEAKYTSLMEGLEDVTNKALDEGTLVDVSDMMRDIENRFRRGVKTKADIKRFEESIPGQFYKKLKENIEAQQPDAEDIRKLFSNPDSPQAQAFIKKYALVNEEKISYKALDDLRKEALDESKRLNRGETGYGEATQIHKMFGNKRHEFIESIGTPEQQARSRQAKKLWREFRDEKTGEANRIFNVEKDTSNDAAFTRMLSNDPTYMKTVIQGTKVKDRGRLLDSILSHMGNKNGEFNLSQLHSNMAKFAKDKSDTFKVFKTLLPNEGNFSQTMKLLGENKQWYDKIANTSKSAHWIHWLDSYKKYGAAAASLWAGDFYTLGSMLAWDSLKYGGAKLMTDPVFLNRINRVLTQAPVRVQKNHIDNFLKYPPVKQALLQASRATLQSHGKNEKEKEND